MQGHIFNFYRSRYAITLLTPRLLFKSPMLLPPTILRRRKNNVKKEPGQIFFWFCFYFCSISVPFIFVYILYIYPGFLTVFFQPCTLAFIPFSNGYSTYALLSSTNSNLLTSFLYSMYIRCYPRACILIYSSFHDQ